MEPCLRTARRRHVQCGVQILAGKYEFSLEWRLTVICRGCLSGLRGLVMVVVVTRRVMMRLLITLLLMSIMFA